MRKSRLSREKQIRLTEYFVAGTTARTAATLVGVNKNAAAYYFHRLRASIAQAIQDEMPLAGEIEVDESYFGGRGATAKVPVFGILKRGGRVYTTVIPNTKAKTLLGIMQARIIPDSIVYTDPYRLYNVLDVSEFKHYRINHSKRFVKKHQHINGMENFWNQAKRHMRHFNGMPRYHFPLLLKECEWRFNNPSPQRQFAQ